MQTSQTRRTRFHVPVIKYTHVRRTQLPPFYEEKKAEISVPSFTKNESKISAGNKRAVVKKYNYLFAQV
jgi:hypothetical protein